MTRGVLLVHVKGEESRHLTAYGSDLQHRRRAGGLKASVLDDLCLNVQHKRIQETEKFQAARVQFQFSGMRCQGETGAVRKRY